MILGDSNCIDAHVGTFYKHAHYIEKPALLPCLTSKAIVKHENFKPDISMIAEDWVAGSNFYEKKIIEIKAKVKPVLYPVCSSH